MSNPQELLKALQAAGLNIHVIDLDEEESDDEVNIMDHLVFDENGWSQPIPLNDFTMTHMQDHMEVRTNPTANIYTWGELKSNIKKLTYAIQIRKPFEPETEDYFLYDLDKGGITPLGKHADMDTAQSSVTSSGTNRIIFSLTGLRTLINAAEVYV